MLLNRIASVIGSNEYAFLGPDFSQCIDELISNDKIGSRGLPAVNEHLHKLHRTSKTKSGFVGVYANGKGFRAVGCKPGGTNSSEHTIGTFPTAEQAALARFMYYKKHGLPYGQFEEDMEWARVGMPEDATVEEVLDHLNTVRNAQGKPPYSLQDSEEVAQKKAAEKSTIKPFGDVPEDIFR